MNDTLALYLVMHLQFVTSNAAKVLHAQAALEKYGITVEQVTVDLVESRAEDPADIALEKARQAFTILRSPCIVEDSGFFIRALGGFPKTHIKFSLSTLGIERILKMLEGESDRHAEWRMSVAYTEGPDARQAHVCTFVEPGIITTEPREVRRKIMSEYWRIYAPVLRGTTDLALCEMSDADLRAWEEHYVSHNQFDQLGRWLTNQ